MNNGMKNLTNLTKNREMRAECGTAGTACVWTLTFGAGAAAAASFCFDFPFMNMETVWCPTGYRDLKDLSQNLETAFCSEAPIIAYCASDGRAVYTAAISEVRRETKLSFSVLGSAPDIRAAVTVDISDLAPEEEYGIRVYIDTAAQPLYEACGKVAAWWAEDAGAVQCPVPEAAYMPLYSSWYAYHADVTAEKLVRECALAKELGAEVFILDDGWQEKYYGDWIVNEKKIPDMKRLVADVHALGMKFLLWYAVCYVDAHSEAWKRFRDMTLYEKYKGQMYVLDPRFPEVREYLISTFETALRAWDLDGFKFDFIQHFDYRGEKPVRSGMDCASVQDAVERLLSDTYARLHAVKKELLFEFRQTYSAPMLKKYANMFRVSDCPCKVSMNRWGITELRLLGCAAVHSDMIMWNPEDTAENAALQILACLFGTIQYSMRIEELPERHRKASAFWLGYAKENRDILLRGTFRPESVADHFSCLRADRGERSVIAVYSPDRIAELDRITDTTLINATSSGEMTVRFEPTLFGGAEYAEADCETRDCTGEVVSRERKRFYPGPACLPVPPAGLFRIRRCKAADDS